LKRAVSVSDAEIIVQVLPARVARERPGLPAGQEPAHLIAVLVLPVRVAQALPASQAPERQGPQTEAQALREPERLGQLVSVPEVPEQERELGQQGLEPCSLALVWLEQRAPPVPCFRAPAWLGQQEPLEPCSQALVRLAQLAPPAPWSPALALLEQRERPGSWLQALARPELRERPVGSLPTDPSYRQAYATAGRR
jgi:hypothetical protein